MTKKSISDKEKELLNRIEKAKEDLLKLQKKQKMELGGLAYKYNLQNIDKKILDNEFKELSKKHNTSK